MNRGLLNSKLLNGDLSAGEMSIVVSIDAILANNIETEFAIDALLQGNYSKTLGVDAVLQGAATGFVSIDAVLATPYKDNGAYYQDVGEGLAVPIDPNKIGQWSTYSRPSDPVINQIGINKQTGKIEYWNGSAWKHYDNSSA